MGNSRNLKMSLVVRSTWSVMSSYRTILKDDLTGISEHIVMIDSITHSFCLRHYVQNGLSYLGEETRPKLCLKRRQATLAWDLLEQINISCYTEYKAFGPWLIYNKQGKCRLTNEHPFFLFKICHWYNEKIILFWKKWPILAGTHS